MEASDFGVYLKKLRKEKKLTIRQLELYSKVSNAYISQMERGERGVPSPDILKKLSIPLGVTYEELMELAGYIEDQKIEGTDLEDLVSIQKLKQAMLKHPDKERLMGEWREWAELLDADVFLKDIELSDEELINKYNFTFKGKQLSDEKTKKILSYIRFVAQEE